MNLGRVATIAANGFRETIRDRILYVIALFGLLFVLSLRLLPEISALSENKIILDFGLGALGFLGALVAIFIGTAALHKEIEKRTVLILIPKPLRRAELLVGKYLGLLGVLAILVAAMGGIYALGLTVANIPYPLGAIAVSLLYLLLELGLLVAAALAFSVFSSPLLAMLMTFGLYLVGHFSRDLVELSKISENPTLAAGIQNLYLILPDLSRFNLKNEAVYGLLPNAPMLLNSAVYGLVYTAVLLAIATAIFSRRQF